MGNGKSASSLSPLDGPRVAYGGELQILEDYRSPSILFSDLTDAGRWTCYQAGPKKPSVSSQPFDGVTDAVELPEKASTYASHPQLEFDRPHHKVHVHFEDKAAPHSRVLWDATYDMGGTGILKATANSVDGGGTLPEIKKMCPPVEGPPHWYQLTVTTVGGSRTGTPLSALDGFVGTQILETFRPDQDPMMDGFDTVPTEPAQPVVPAQPAHPKQMGLPAHSVGLALGPLLTLRDENCVACHVDFEKRLRRKPWTGPQRSREFLLVERRPEPEQKTKPSESIGRIWKKGQVDGVCTVQ